MKKLILLVYIISAFFIGCNDDNGDNHSQQTQEIIDPIAPETLTEVILDFQNEVNVAFDILTLKRDGSAKSYQRITLCCWVTYYGNYIYEREEADIGTIYVSYTSEEIYQSGSNLSTSSIRSEEYTLYFNDEVSGSYSMIDDQGNTIEGTFTIEDIE